jgi:hypothetical protein
MPNINNFQDNFRQFRIKFEIDFGSGFVDRTKFLKSFNMFQELSEISYGVCETTAYFELTVSNPSVDWTKKGLPVKYTVGITDDQGQNYFDVVIFEGKTSQKSTVSRNQIKLEAKDRLFEILEKKPPNRLLFTYQLTNSVLTSIIQNTQPGQGVVFFDLLNYPITYLQSHSKTLKEHIIDFAKLASSIVIMEGTNIVFVNLQNIGMRNIYTLQGDIPLSKVGVGKYNINHSLTSAEYFNVFKVKGKVYSFTNLVFTGAFSNIKVEPNNFLFLSDLDLKGVIPQSIPIVSAIFRANDNDTSPIINVDLVSSSIIDDKTILLKFKNPTQNQAFLRTLTILGQAIQPLSDIESVWENTPQITLDGVKTEFTINSAAIQNQGSVDNLITIQKNLTNNYYEFTCLWSPKFLVGKVITARTPNNTLIYGIITNLKVEQVKALIATVRIRQFIPNNTTWFTLNSSPLSISGHPLI